MARSIPSEKKSTKQGKYSKQEMREHLSQKKEEEKSKIKKLTPPPPKIN